MADSTTRILVYSDWEEGQEPSLMGYLYAIQVRGNLTWSFSYHTLTGFWYKNSF